MDRLGSIPEDKINTLISDIIMRLINKIKDLI